ncbi:MAG: hypothetical protein FWG16_01420 [Micrococcales bacterium]|nr:hypothetical protein [Micrococcales bacterium]
MALLSSKALFRSRRAAILTVVAMGFWVLTACTSQDDAVVTLDNLLPVPKWEPRL